MSVKTTSVMKRRLNGFAAAAVAAVLVLISIGLFRISVTESAVYQELANDQQFSSTRVRANRGSIYDKNGQVLAQSATVYTIFVDPKTFQERDTEHIDYICQVLSEALDVEASDVREKCFKDNAYQEIKKQVEKTTAVEILEKMYEEGITSVGATPQSKRFYPQNEMAASVIGHLHYDGYGIYGLESYYDDYLTGVDGRIITAKDAHGNEIPYKYKQSYDAQDGDSLYTNLDMTIQYYTEKALAKQVQENEAVNRGCAIVMNCNTGEILAMATSPGYDLNSPAEIYDQSTAERLAGIIDDEELYTEEKSAAWAKQWKNKAISELYYPGSVFKVITGSSALEEKIISTDDTFYCTGSIVVADRTINCWSSKAHGVQDFVTAMTNSCNPAFVQIGQALGAKLFCQYFEAYGFTEKTGIDLPSEADSIYVPYSRMSLIDLSVCAFGQTNKVTPIQMITAYAATINGGYLVTPYLVDKIVDTDGNVVKDYEPTIKRQVISEETSAIMRETLESVVNTNNGSNAYIKGYSIGGKSGTSQKLDENPEGNTYVSSYVGFFPAEDPEIIMLAMVDDPRGGDYYGSKVAAPVVSEVFEQILPYLGYFAEYTEEELERLEIAIPDVTGADLTRAQSTITSLGFKCDVVGEGGTVVKQVPSSGNSIPRGGTIILYTEEDYDEDYVIAPDLSGMTLREATETIQSCGLNLKPLGGAVYKDGATASVQNYVGVSVPKGTVIEAYFYVNDETG